MLAFALAFVAAFARSAFRVPGGFAPDQLVGTVRKQKKPRTLAQRLEAAGIAVLPKDKVRAHKRRALRQYRQGVWKYLWPLAVYDQWMEIILITTIGGGVTLACWGHWMVGLVIALPTVVCMVMKVIVLLTGNRMNMLMAASRWMVAEELDYRISMVWRTYLQAPESVWDIWERAREVATDAAFQVEYLYEDPFLIVRRGREWCYIAAWNTGDAELDSV